MNFTIKSSLRNLRSKPIYSLITFVGFTFGITGGLLIYLWVMNELSYDKFHMDYDRIYRVLTLSKQSDEIVKSSGSYRPLPATLKKDYPQIEFATFLYTSSENLPLQKKGGEKIEARESWVTNDFFSIFNGFPFIEGNAFDAIENASGIILSETVAQKLFGSEPALGKTVIIDKYDKRTYSVSGVIRVPKNSHIDIDYILPEVNSTVTGYVNHWGDKYYNRVYVKLREDAVIDDAFLNRISNHLSRYSKKTDKLLFQPLANIHLYSDYEPNSLDKNISSYKYVLIFSGLALLIILMASLNFSVLSVARASERSTEIGIKKVNGAGRFHIIKQFMGESLVHTVAAMFVAVLVIWFILPWFNNFTGKDIAFSLSFSLIRNLVLIALLTGVAAGLYPSFYLSSLNPTGILRGGSVSGSRTQFVRLLVSVQFGIAIVFMVATTVFIKQLNYVRSKDLGLTHENVVVVPTGLWYGNHAFKQELMKNPNVLGVSASVYAPVDFGWKTSFPLTNLGRTDSLNASLFWADEDFAKTYQLEMVKGEFLTMNGAQYWEEHKKANEGRKEEKNYTFSFPIVINETAEKMLGLENPVGERIGNNEIVGVVKDFHFRPLYQPIGPLVITNNPQTIQTMNIRIAPNNKAETIKYIRDIYQKHTGGRGFSYQYFDDLMDERYKAETRLKNITTAFSLLAIVISVLGILGMALFSIARRTKEIGIRKVNGAKVYEILTMLNKDFVKWVIIAFVIATPIAYYAMNKWLENFAYKTTLSWWIFALAGMLALGIALLTVSWQSWRAATRNPVEALRYE
ncbi:FtsX-like permease family protein [uncultured Sunxiuqinia sp.]|uniref:FtsX-like permease family protein n=1 Tax=uncultured Sunxiuqinia sp. TaxID=1573825 RepID=UPI002AA7CAA2|nr:FtsX-like permease family protein [uncultured Sunxiuqinia sp.]